MSFAASVSGLPTAIRNQNYVLHLAASGTQAALKYTVSWGDGQPDTVTSNNPPNPVDVQHVYGQANASFAPTVTATPSGGGSTYTAPFALKSAFANNAGRTVVDPTANNDNANAMALDSSGNIYMVGSYNGTGSTSKFGVTRFHPDGSLDNTFGTSGTVNVSFDSGNDIAYAVAIDHNGKILLAGTCASGWGVIRLNTDGTYDTSFSGDVKFTGFVTTGRPNSIVEQVSGYPSQDSVYDLLCWEDAETVWHNITIGPTNYTDRSSNQFAAARYDKTGHRETTWGPNNNGLVAVPSGRRGRRLRRSPTTGT